MKMYVGPRNSTPSRGCFTGMVHNNAKKLFHAHMTVAARVEAADTRLYCHAAVCGKRQVLCARSEWRIIVVLL